eukprot:15464032-Alexandrium_andersonii.AAC.1
MLENSHHCWNRSRENPRGCRRCSLALHVQRALGDRMVGAEVHVQAAKLYVRTFVDPNAFFRAPTPPAGETWASEGSYLVPT